MFDLIKKTLLTSVGFGVITKEKIEEIGKELIKKGEVTEKEGKEFIDSMLKRSEKAQKEMETKVYGMIQESIGKLNLATKKDITQLEKKIARLEKRVKDEDKQSTNL